MTSRNYLRPTEPTLLGRSIPSPAACETSSPRYVICAPAVDQSFELVPALWHWPAPALSNSVHLRSARSKPSLHAAGLPNAPE